MKRLYRVPIALVVSSVARLLAMLTDSTEDLYRPDAYRARVENQRRMLRDLWVWAWGNTDVPDRRSAP